MPGRTSLRKLVDLRLLQEHHLSPVCLRRWNDRQSGGGSDSDQAGIVSEVDGFASLSRRFTTSKPVIAAVNGGAHGGGTEIVLNCDIVVASEDAKFALPEVKRGVVAVQGGKLTLSSQTLTDVTIGMPRLARIAGHQVGYSTLLQVMSFIQLHALASQRTLVDGQGYFCHRGRDAFRLVSSLPFGMGFNMGVIYLAC